MNSFVGIEDMSGYEREHVVRVTFDGCAVGLFFMDVEDSLADGTLVYLSAGLRDRKGQTRGSLFPYRDAERLEVSILAESPEGRSWRPIYNVENCSYDSYNASYASFDKNGGIHETLVLRGELRAL